MFSGRVYAARLHGALKFKLSIAVFALNRISAIGVPDGTSNASHTFTGLPFFARVPPAGDSCRRNSGN